MSENPEFTALVSHIEKVWDASGFPPLKVIGPLTVSTVQDRSLLIWQREGETVGLAGLELGLGFGSSRKAAMEEWVDEFIAAYGKHINMLPQLSATLLLSNPSFSEHERLVKTIHVFDVVAGIILSGPH